MQNNWVLLRGRLCHKPNHTATKKGLHKVAFRLAVPRVPRSTDDALTFPPVDCLKAMGELFPSSGAEADYVTVIIIGRPAYEFQQLDLGAGAAVCVQGRLRSWDQPRDEATGGSRDPNAGCEKTRARRDYRIEVIAAKVDLIE